MTESKFLNFVFIEGIILMVSGLLMLIFPRITTVTFGVMMCICLFSYGLFKIINAFITRNYVRHYLFNILLGVAITILSIVLFFIPTVNILVVNTILGVYFILESFSSKSFAFKTKNSLYLWWTNLVLAFIQFFIGLIIILGLPSIPFVFICLLLGIDFLLNGTMLITLYIANKNIYEM